MMFYHLYHLNGGSATFIQRHFLGTSMKCY
jgi:hypothetical protein